MSKQDPRMSDCSEVVLFENLKKAPKNSAVIVSYPDDEGVRYNGGRAGAVAGPDRILYYFKKLVAGSAKIFILESEPLSRTLLDRQERAERMALKIHQLGYKLITLGGGHDYGYPDAAAFYQTYKGNILNIDAHLDLRPVVDGVINSGTGFFQFCERFGGKALTEWGILKHVNADAHFAYAKKKGVKVFNEKAPLPHLKSKHVGLSVCLDAFAGVRGVSAPQMIGLSIDKGLLAIDRYAKKSPWLGIYECAPSLDPVTEDSARLAALLMHRYLEKSFSK